ncbi:ABC transporter permease [Alteribacillus bidgolensis]|uniref:NitT/TauT family transport system permease protein n=1 Tax=Alteribacillus bidgolensis TaxID=930129 RepID=A0A1G8FRK3_9BACI|nr:ABC transporter permease [Alteribacillus bidgolensis]SDH84741.1 NitT/TauT family transport system permease protein [Alteribacillus bidgolensis]
MQKNDTVPISRNSTIQRLKKIRKDKSGLMISTLAIVLFIIGWEIVSRNEWVNPLFISSPLAIIQAAATMLQEPDFWKNLGVSGYEFGVGFLLAMVIGIPMGVFSGWNSTFNAIVNPFISGLYVTPKVTLLPVIIIAFGIGPASKIVIVFLMAFFPIVMSAQKAMNTLDQSLIKASRTFTANDFQVFKTIALPSTVPFLLNGIRLGIGQGLIAVVVGELFASSAGIGYQLTSDGQNLQTDRMFVGVLVITLTGITLTALLGTIERRFSSWKPENN